ncbi:hypothetical protein C0Q70_10301 [Pomacea canaliculata]|uniref:G-protein coupled receptors family 1 profile domain-containing protein n=1 Tax=Pomacea canaliculata TaxID=400727 RepID=A0A2T7PC84_POMCA|nr:hypothetical protein C0Q70_10301 [Pomacea canaliculata]
MHRGRTPAARGEDDLKDLQQDRPLDNGKVFSTDCHHRCTVRSRVDIAEQLKKHCVQTTYIELSSDHCVDKTVSNPEPLLSSSMATILDKTLIAAVLLMIGLLVIAVNLLTIVVVLRTPQLRHSDQWQANMYVLSLAVADLLVGAALVWMACLFIPEARAIINSSYVLCISGAIVYTVFISVSHVTMLAIALDRLCYIVYPFFYERFVSDRFTKALIFTIWCSSVIISSTTRVFQKRFLTGDCKIFAGGNAYERIILNISLLFEFFVSGACYIWIACVVRNQKRRIRTMSQVKANISSKENEVLCNDNHAPAEDKQVRPKTSVGISDKHMSAEEAQENVHLQPQTVPTVQDPSNHGDTLQAGPHCQDSSDVEFQSRSHVNGIDHVAAQSVDVDVSLATNSLCLHAGGPETGPVHQSLQVRVSKPPVTCCVPQNDRNSKNSQNVVNTSTTLPAELPYSEKKADRLSLYSNSMEFSLDNALIAAAILLVGLAVMVVNLLTIVVVLRTPQLRHSDQPQANLYVVNLAVADTLAARVHKGNHLDNLVLVGSVRLHLSLAEQVFGSSWWPLRATFGSLSSFAASNVEYAPSCTRRSNHSPQDGYTTDKDNVETPKPRVFATNHRPEAREDPVSCVKCQLELKPVAFFPNGGGNGDASLQVKSVLQDVSGKTLQPDFASPSADHLEVESTKVNILLATEKIEKLTGLASASHVKDPIQARTGSKPFKPPEAQSIPQKDINVKKTTNVAMFVVINLFFTLSWLPLVVYLMFFDTAQEYNDIILDLLIMPTYANSLLNFAVYTWKNTEYRNAYKRLFKNNICCRST